MVLVREGSLWSLAPEEAASGPEIQTTESLWPVESECLSRVCLLGEENMVEIPQACESWARAVPGRGLSPDCPDCGEGKPTAALGSLRRCRPNRRLFLSLTLSPSSPIFEVVNDVGPCEVFP